MNTPRPNLLVFDSYASRFARKSSESLASIQSVLIGLKLTLSKLTFMPLPTGYALTTFDTDPVRQPVFEVTASNEASTSTGSDFDLLSEVGDLSIPVDEDDVSEGEGLE